MQMKSTNRWWLYVFNLSLHYKLTQNSRFKNTYIPYLTESASRKETLWLNLLDLCFSQAAIRLWSHLKAQHRKVLLPSSFTWLVEGSISSQLLNWGLTPSPALGQTSPLIPCLLAVWASPLWASPLSIWQRGSWLHQNEKALARWKLQSFVIWSQKWHPITFTVIY